jgi:site-specific DNA recombinase
MDRAIIYARVSTDEQALAHSLPSQLEACRGLCQKKGYVIVREVKEDFTGTSATRPALSAVLEEPGLFDVLVVFSIDRFARGLAVQVLLEKELQDAGKRIEYVMGGGENTPEGRLTNQIQAVIAEYEVQQIKRRTTRGHYARAKAGHVAPGRTPAYGYKYVGSERGGKYEIVPEEAKVVKQVFDWYTEEKVGMIQIARRLTERGELTKWDLRGYKRKRRRGVWGVSTIHSMLRNMTYAGTWLYGRRNAATTTVSVDVPPIISKRQFQKAQLQATANLSNSKRNTQNEFLMRRRLVCGVCGMKFSCNSHYRTGLTYRCYGTYSRNLDYKNTKCKQNYSAGRIDQLAWEGVKQLLLKPELVRQGWSELAKRNGSADIQHAITTLRERVEELEGRRDRLVELYADNQIPRSSLDKQVAAINADLVTATDRLKELGKATPPPTKEALKSAEAFLQELAKGVDLTNYAEKESIVKVIELTALVTPGPALSMTANINGVPYAMTAS